MSSPKPPPLPYQSAQPPTSHAPVWVFHFVVLIMTFAAWVLVVGIMVVVVPHFETIFKDFKTELPAVTILLLKVSRWCGNDFGWLLSTPLIAAPFLFSYLLDRAALDQRQAVLRAILVICGLVFLVLAFIVFTFVAIYAPGVALIQSVSGSAKK